MTTTDTPQTDAAHNFDKYEEYTYGAVLDCSRKLERELNASKAEVERLAGQLIRAVSIAGVLLADIEDFHGNATDEEWTSSGWNDSRISKSLLQQLMEEIK